MAFILDPNLERFATPRQWELLTALTRHPTERLAAEAVNCDKRRFHEAKERVMAKAARHGYAPEHDLIHQSAPGFHVKGTSTLYGPDGELKAQWVKTDRDREEQDKLMREAVEGLCSEIKPLKPARPPKHAATDLMSFYPVGDHHIGMLAWAEEAEDDYDTKKSEELLRGAFDYLVSAAPDSGVGLIVLIGDFLHYDSYDSVTPQSKHILDADSRYPRIVRAAMRTVRHAISRALDKHKLVRVIVVAGNHDASSMVFLREALCALYENEKRVEVDRSPKLFHYYRFGKFMIGAHHGDKVKMQNLPLLMASDQPEDWGKTKHRLILTGHVHHDSVKDFNGAKVESIRILAPADAYAYGVGYRTPRDMKRIDVHAEYGEVGRQITTPEMIA